jgi:tetratricopeptide (TPR) repeat protein
MKWIGGVIFLCLLGVVYFWYDAYVTKIEAEVSRSIALSAKNQAEKLLSFLLGEQLLEQVRDIGRSTILEQVKEEMKGLFAGANDQETALIRGLRQRNDGDVESMQGHLAKSITLFEQALQLIESSPDNPDNLDRPREIARTRNRLGEALFSKGYVGEALKHYTVAVEAWERVVKGEAKKVEDCYSLAESLVSAGELKARMGKETLAIKDIYKATNIIMTAPFGSCGEVISKAMTYQDSKALEILSRALVARASISDEMNDFETAARLAIEAKTLSPT